MGWKRVDANQSELVKTIRKMGASFQHTSSIKGALDGIIGYRGVDQRIEIKDPNQPPSQRKLTPAEAQVFDEWKGRPPLVVETVDDVIAILKSIRETI